MYKAMDHCGIVVCHSLHDTYKALKAIQHRGQDTAGIAAKNRHGVDILRWQGYVDNFSLENMHKILNGSLFIGHVRYATYGEKNTDALFQGAHPRFIDTDNITEYRDPPHPHLIARGATKAIVHNGTLVGVSCDGDLIDTDIMLRAYSKNGIEWVMKCFPASYASAILDMRRDEVVVFRDRHGIRPLWIGEKDGRVVAASEDVAIWDIGGKPIREVRPGEAVYIDMEGTDIRSNQVVEPSPNTSLCFFEFNYNSAASSTLDGKSIKDVGYRIGMILASEYTPDVDFVTYIPNRPKSMARGYSDSRGLPFVEVFYKVRMERAFLGPTREKRAQSIGSNLFILDNVDLRGKRIVVVDDSVVRLTNAPDAAKKLRDRGAEWIALVLGTPVIGPVIDGEEHGCLFGVDMPPGDDFAIQRCGDLDGIKKESGFDDVYYISTDGLAHAHGVPSEQRCMYCIGGPNPVKEEELKAMEAALAELDI